MAKLVCMRFMWVPQDLWIGVFYSWMKVGGFPEPEYVHDILIVYVCFVPCFPLRVEIDCG